MALVTTTLGLPGSLAAASSPCTPRLESVVTAVPSTLGGVPIRASVRLTCAASTRTRVRLLASDGVTVPRSVVVPPGARRVGFRFVTDPSETVRRGRVTAMLGGVSRSARVTTEACLPEIRALEIPAVIHAGDEVRARVRLTCAVAAPVTITLSSSTPMLIAPVQVRVVAGRGGASFPLASPLVRGDTQEATLSATLGGSHATREVSVTAGISEAYFANRHNQLYGELLFSGHLPPEGVTVGLESSSAALGVPPTYHLPASRSRIGYVLAVDTHPVTETTPVTLTVTLGSRSVTMSTVLFAPDGQSGMYSYMSSGGNEGDPYVLYGGDRSRTLEVGVRPGARTSASLVVSVSGDIEALPDWTYHGWVSDYWDTGVGYEVAKVSRTSYLFLHARHGAFFTSLAVTVHPGLAAVELPETLVGGGWFPATVHLAGPADDDVVVSLRQSGGGISDLGQVTIPAGESSATVYGFASPVDTPTKYKYSGHLGTTGVNSPYMTVMPSSEPVQQRPGKHIAW